MRMMNRVKPNINKTPRRLLRVFALFLFALSFISYTPNAQAQDITSDLVGHWTMDNIVGTSVVDETGNTNGTWSSDDSPGAIKTVPGISGNAVYFDGTTDFIDLGAGIGTPFSMEAENAVTISAWAQVETGGAHKGIFAFGGVQSGNDNTSYSLYVFGDNNWRMQIADDTNIVAPLSKDGLVHFGQWVHVAMTWDGTDAIIYLNGEPIESNNAPGFTLTDPESGGADEVYIGRGSNGGHWIGAIDEVRLYSRGLTAEEIRALYDEVSPQQGYFVLVGNQPINDESNEFDGDLGGLDGANATCMNYLTNHDWRGKDVAEAKGMITPGNVKAWLCSDEGCQNMLPNMQYSFAKTEAGAEDAGGASFITDADGHYPDTDTNAWDGDGYFERNTWFWTGRETDQTNTPRVSLDCDNWSVDTGPINGYKGHTTEAGDARWSDRTELCDTTDQFICFVNPVVDHDYCNAEHAGKMIYNTDYRVMQYCDGAQWIDMGKKASVLHGQKTSGIDYEMNAVEFDNDNDYIRHSAAFTGVSDSNKWTFSFWLKRNMALAGITDYPFMFGVDDSAMVFYASNNFTISARDASDTAIFRVNSNTQIDDDEWHHVMLSIDLSDTNKRHLYLDGAEVSAADWAIYDTDGVIDFDQTGGKSIGVDGANTNNKFAGSMADFWMDFGTYIDLSAEANRRKFINANGQAVNLGVDGSRPTGAAPEIFLSGDTANWHINKGTGGGFTETGEVTDATPPPHEYQQKLIGWWKLDETKGNTVTDSSDGGNDGSMAGSMSASNSNVSGPVNTALSFDGTDDSIDLGSNITADADAFTMCLWARRQGDGSGNSWQEVIGNGVFQTEGWHLNLEPEGTNATFFVHRAGARESATVNVGSTDDWHHYCASWDETNIRLYVDGTLGDTSPNTTMVKSSQNLFLGIAGPGNTDELDGSIDDVRLYNYALSAEEIEELYYASNVILDYIPNAVNLAGETPQRIRNSCCSDTNGTSFTGSLWIRFTDWPGHNQYIMDSNSENRIYFTTAGDMFFYFRSPTNDDRVVLTAETNLEDNYGWHHIIYSFDVTNPANSYVYMDDTPVTLDNTTTNGTIEFNPTNFTVLGQRNGSANAPHIDVADYWFDYNTFIDLSVEANRRDFIDANGYPVDLGADGSLPTGSAPTLFLTGNAANMDVNSGSGNDFALVEGTFTDVPGPAGDGKVPRECSNPAYPEGTLIYNSDENVMQYCDAYRWIPLGPPGNGGGGCSNPSGVAGSLIFNTDFDTLQYCEGDEWIGVGRDPTVSALAEGLIIHYRFDESAGPTAADSSGNGYDGTYTGTPVPASGVINGGLSFQKDEGDGISFSGAPEVYDHTVSVWANLDSLDIAGTIFLSTDSLWFEVHPAYIECGTNPAARTQFSTTSIVGGGWKHLACTRSYADRVQKIFIDGALVATSNFTNSDRWSDGEGTVGIHENPTSEYDVDGTLDDFRLYGRELSNTEIRALYEMGMTLPTPATNGLVAHYRLDENSGATVSDSSGSGHNGTHTHDSATPNWSSGMGQIDGALLFDPSDEDTIDVGNWELPGNDGLTLSVWVNKNITDGQDRRIIAKTDGGGSSDYAWMLVHDNGNRLSLRLKTVNGYDTQYVSLDDDFFLNRWTLVTVTYDAATDEIVYYINGFEFGTDTHSDGGAVDNTTGRDIAIGNHPSSTGDTASSRSWSGYLDDVRIYDRPLTPTEVAEMYIAGTGQYICGSASPTPGDVCPDGTVFVGMTPDGGLPMYTSRCDYGQTWDGSSCTGSRTQLPWNDGTSNWLDVGIDSTTNGEANTAALVTTDSATTTGGVEPHLAAEACDDLELNGYNDWYLPASEELEQVRDNYIAIGNFPAPPPVEFYWSSSQDGADTENARRVRLNCTPGVDHGSCVTDGDGNNKANDYNIRCVRK